ncbi:MAG: ComF family protein [Candidatus Omnitrophica bacterium]|nr:ComF family protein [Candidatus Omnitrophota bacterium]
MLKKILTLLIDMLFPRNCILCQAYHQDTDKNPLCPSCFKRITFNHPPFCVRCSRHIDTISEEGLCPDCRKRLPEFDYAWACTLYKGAIKDLVPRFKFHNKTSLKNTFGALAKEFFNHFPVNFKNVDYLVPIPLHSTRQRERGYNQSLLLAEELSQALGIPLNNAILERIRPTQAQSELGAKERWTNLEAAFRIKTFPEVSGRHIILVDDLLTTGATASEAAKTLKAAGAQKVGLITLAIVEK